MIRHSECENKCINHLIRVVFCSRFDWDSHLDRRGLHCIFIIHVYGFIYLELVIHSVIWEIVPVDSALEDSDWIAYNLATKRESCFNPEESARIWLEPGCHKTN